MAVHRKRGALYKPSIHPADHIFHITSRHVDQRTYMRNRPKNHNRYPAHQWDHAVRTALHRYTQAHRHPLPFSLTSLQGSPYLINWRHSRMPRSWACVPMLWQSQRDQAYLPPHQYPPRSNYSLYPLQPASMERYLRRDRVASQGCYHPPSGSSQENARCVASTWSCCCRK